MSFQVVYGWESQEMIPFHPGLSARGCSRPTAQGPGHIPHQDQRLPLQAQVLMKQTDSKR